MKKNHYVLMSSSLHAMRLYQRMEKEGIESTLAPTPRSAAHCCGVSILHYNDAQQEQILALAQSEGIEIDGFHTCENTDNPNRHKYC